MNDLQKHQNIISIIFKDKSTLYQNYQMEFRQKMLEFYHSGRYECDYDFYVYLRDILNALNLYHWEDRLEQQLSLVKRIKDLTDVNSNSLDQDYDEEEGVCQTLKIKSMIGNLNTKDIATMIEQCDQQGWQPMQIKINKQLKGSPKYQQIVQRIKTTIHSKQFRIECMIFLAFFQFIHGDQIEDICQIYLNSIEYYLQFLMGCRKKLELLSESSQYSNICALPKTKAFVGTLYYILRACFRFCEIVKVLTGRNNLSLKFTVAKKDIEKLINRHQEWGLSMQKEDLFTVLPFFKKYLNHPNQPLNKEKICKWCFKPLTKAIHQHSFCHQIIDQKQQFIILS